MKKDPYQVLGLHKDCSLDEIKKRFRDLALKHHPDQNNNSESSKVLFQEIHNAYTFLIDFFEKKEKDNNFYSNFINEPQSVFVKITISLEEVALGCKKDITISLFDNCNSCKGSSLICSVCKGFGKVEIRKVVRISIPAGVESNAALRFTNQKHDSIFFEVICVVEVMNHPIFIRKNRKDLYTKLKLSYPDACLGTKISFKTLTNKVLNVKIRPGIQSGEILKIANEGLPSYYLNEEPGNLFLVAEIKVPTEISNDVKKILMSLRKIL